jgi:hypothetical protein
MSCCWALTYWTRGNQRKIQQLKVHQAVTKDLTSSTGQWNNKDPIKEKE